MLYLLTSLVGFFAMGYAPGKLIVYTDSTTTAGNIATHQMLFRLGIAGSLIGQTAFTGVKRITGDAGT